MAERLAEAFARGGEEGRALLMPFFVCGYPDGDTFVALAQEAAAAGADVLEVGIPFSDPIMDGPVIQAATMRVLEREQRVDDALALIERATAASGLPVVAMTYYNLPFRRGLDRFARALASAGAAGAILPDLSVEDSASWRAACASAGLDAVFIAAPTSPDERLRAIGETARGFVYAAAVLGVTGVRESLDADTARLVERIREACTLPVAVGIGVSTAAHARAVAAYADGVIIGSAVVRAIDAGEPVASVGAFLREARAACVR